MPAVKKITTSGMGHVMTKYDQAVLVVHAVNTLRGEGTCCPHGCAPCGVLLRLMNDNALTRTI